MMFAPQEQGPLAAQVHDRLLDMILRFEMKPYQRLSEAWISDNLNVSRTPAREALLRLSLQGYVEIRPQRGTFVAPLRTSELKLSQFMREAVELSLIDRLFDRGTLEAAGTRMAQEIELQKVHASVADPRRFSASDEAFHDAIALAADLPEVLPELRRLKGQMDRFRFLTMSGIDDLADVVEQHEEIVAAFRARDKARAKKAMRSHLRRIFMFSAKAQQAYPEYFDEA